jgi:catechol 2,3-dioxygenase-like lactoylglutathione lyase family enzyme
MRKSVLCSAAATLALALGLSAAHADGLPGMRGHDHTGITVPDMNEALTFFVDVLGCKKAMSFGPIADPDPNGTFMKDALGVDPKTVIKQITLVRCGIGSNIELFSYQSPDQKVVQPKNSDIGGYHIAFYVDDIKAAADYLHAKGVKTMMGPIPITEGPAAGQAIVYFNAPWGLQLEAISYPKGMAYEKEASTVLWTPKDPAK